MISQRIPIGLVLVAGVVGYFTSEAPRAPAAEPKEARLKELLKERVETLRTVVELSTAQYQQGILDYGKVYQSMHALVKAELDVCESDKERITVLEKLVAVAKKHEKVAEARFKAGGGGQRDVLMAKADRLEAEIALERMKVKAKDPTK
jgi:outer membrane protein TolC